jgi:hypothetical protein
VKRLAFVLLVFVACKPAPAPSKPAASAVPQMRATVVAIRTTVMPEKKSYDSAVVISGNLARSTGEQDTWRLFDTKAKTVTFVDDVAKTIRTEPLADLVRKRNEVHASTLPQHFPRATFARTDERRDVQGVSATKVVIASGAYKRELWLGEHAAIPKGLFAMMIASETPSSPLAPMMRDVDLALADERGFPLDDRTTIPVGKGDMVIAHTVTGIAQKDVPQSLLALPRGYQNLTPKGTK